MVQDLSEPQIITSRLDKMERKTMQNKLSLNDLMYSNINIVNQKFKTSLYDYQKIQSTEHGSQFLGQRHFLMGGPSSGNHSSIIRQLHNSHDFKSNSKSPPATFDQVRGSSPTLNSYNDIRQFLPGEKEKPRYTVLKNFKEINRIMTSTFVKGKMNESKFKTQSSEENLDGNNEKEALEKMKKLMQ